MSNRVSPSGTGPATTKSAEESGPTLRDLVTKPDPFDPAAAAATITNVTESNSFAMNMFDTPAGDPAAAGTESQASSDAPSPQSFFGSDPWMDNPTGIAPNGTTYSYNKYYFATADAAAKIAEMVGGKVVEKMQMTPTGGMFRQSQPNYMVELPDGRLINPGLVASFFDHGYPQSYIDQMIAAEIRNA